MEREDLKKVADPISVSFWYTLCMYIGIDIGGTHTDVVASESLEDIRFGSKKSIPTVKNFENGMDQVQQIIETMTKTPIAIGVGVPGYVEKGEFSVSLSLPDWTNKSVGQILKDKFNCPVYIHNDGVTGALGEAYFGGEKNQDFFYITWGTGVGCAIIKWKENIVNVFRPENRQPVIDLSSRIGGYGIEEVYGKPASELTDNEWNDVLMELKESLSRFADIYRYDLFVLGGGIVAKQKVRIQSGLESLEQPKVKISNLDGESGLYGALVLIREKITA